MAFIYDLVDQWSGGGAFTGIKLNVTDSGSTAGSLLMDLQVGGVSQFRVSKAGAVTGVGTFSTTSVAASVDLYWARDLLATATTGAIKWGDLTIVRDAANTLAQRNGVNAQAFNLYNTYTDASNYERGFMRYVSNRLEIGHEAAGTGTAGRTIAFRTQGFDALTLSSLTATFNVNLALAIASISTMRNILNQDGYTQMQEMTAPAAPAADRVRIYAEDNGSGKTRLMALFATGAAVQIAIEP